jgi:hypothetical protein
VLVVAGLLLYRWVRDDGPADAPGNPRYCGLSAQLVQELAAVGVPAAGPVPPSLRPEDVRKVLAQLGAKLDELGEAAPPAARRDVKTVVVALKQGGAGDLSGMRSPGFLSAEQSITGLLRTPQCQASPNPAGDGS